MSASSDNPSVVNQLPLSIKMPESYQEFIPIMDLLYKRIADAVNKKTGSLFSQQEFGNFELFYTPGNPQAFRNVYREVIQFTNLQVGANNQPHNIPSIIGFTFTHIYGTIQNSTPTAAAAIPQGETGANNGVAIDVNTTNVVVTLHAGSPYVGFNGYVILEYTKN